MSIWEYFGNLTVDGLVTGGVIVIVVVVVLLVRRSDSVTYYPGVDIASVEVEPGRTAVLSFETPDASLIPPRIAKEMQPGFLWPGYPPCALWLESYLEEIDRNTGIVPSVTMAVKIEPAGADVIEHAGFRIGRSLRAGVGGSPLVGQEAPELGGRASHGFGFYRATQLIAPFRLPPLTRVDVTVRIDPNENTRPTTLRLFAARPAPDGGVPG